MKEHRPLPTSWSWARFDEVAEVESDLVAPKGFESAPHIAPNHIESGTGRLLEYQTVAADGVTSPKHRFRAGQVLYSKIRPYLAKAVLVDFNGLCSADMYPVRSNIEARFLHRWLISHEFTALASRQQGRTVLPKINQDALNVLPVPVPPLNEQRRIVAKIEALTARSRTAREALEQAPPLLERFRQSVLAAAFRGGLTAEWRRQHPDVEPASVLLESIRAERRRRWEEAELAAMRAKGKAPANDKWKEKYQEPARSDSNEAGELPAGWCWAALDELAWDAGYGTSAKCDYEGKGPPVLRIPNVAGGRLLLEDMKFALDPAACSGDALEPLDFLIVRTNGSRDLIGRGAVVEQPLTTPHYFASYLIRFRLACTPLIARWVAALWESPVVRRTLESEAATSAGQYNVNLTKLARLTLPLPPAEELVPLLAAIDGTASAREAALDRVRSSLSRLESLDQSILAKAFRGELVPQDPSDEPASVLLDRIRAEREAADGTRARRGRRARASEAEPTDAEDEPDDAPTAARATGTNGNGSTLHAVLGALKREALHRIAGAEGVELADRRSLDAARAGVIQGGVTLEAALEHLDRDELKAVCRALGLEDRGRTREELRARITSR